MGRTKRKARVSDPFRFDRAILTQLSSQITASDTHKRDLCVAGVDEAGRGSLAGPLVAAAVVLDYAATPEKTLVGLTDSKLLSAEARESLYARVLVSAQQISWVACSPATIDEKGLHVCNLMALGQALDLLKDSYLIAIVDGFALERPSFPLVQTVVGADYKSAAVAAASVVAKVVRDRLMHVLDQVHPEYGFAEHVGYATERHRDALRANGPCSFHRLSFQGVGAPQLKLWRE